MSQIRLHRIHNLLIKKNKTLAVAESCTGGLLAKLLTDLSGSSAYFILGLTTYSNDSKIKVLGIPPNVLLKHGAVSKETAAQMALRVRKISRSDFGLSTTGIAGPTGGTALKPIGTVYICVSSAHKTLCIKHIFKGNRNSVRTQAACKALDLLASFL